MAMPADILYLHGFGSPSWGFLAAQCPIFHAMERILSGKGVRLHAPNYHPGGQVEATQPHTFLKLIEQQAEQLPSGRFAAIVGCSFGGWLASILQDRRPDLFGAAILLAPAIDQYQRNYEDVPCERWHMPACFVDEVRALPARPTIRIPTMLLHGLLDNDMGGSAPWRIHEWCSENTFSGCFFPAGVDHSLEPWLNQEGKVAGINTKSFSELLDWSLSAAAVTPAVMALRFEPWVMCAGSVRDQRRSSFHIQQCEERATACT